MFERGREGGVAEQIPGGEEPGRFDPLTRQQESIGHFSQRQPKSESGRRKDRRPPDDLPQGLREIAIRERLRRHKVGRPADRLGLKAMGKRRDHVIKGYPAHPLLPAAQDAAKSESEWSEHSAKRPTSRTKHDSEPRVNHANTTL